LPPISVNEILKKCKKKMGGAAPPGGYGCSAPKGDNLHPRVQETFPENFVKIG